MIRARLYGLPAVLLAATVLMAPAFAFGHITGHSSLLNVGWSEGFAEGLFAGDPYPRWLPEMSRGAGSPAFYFYGPLPFYLMAPFHLVAEPRLAVVLGCWLMLALSGLSFFALARAFVQPWPASVGAMIYMATPYHLLADIWVRAAVGEQAAFIFIPVCLLCAYRLGEGRGPVAGLAAGFAGLLLSHLPSALIFSPFLVCFCLWSAWRGDFPNIVIRAAVAAVLSGGLAGAYIVPAMLLQPMAHAEYWGTYLPQEYFLFGENGLGFSRFLEFSFIATGGIAALSAAIMIAGRLGRAAAPWIAIAMAVAFLVTPLSAWFWGLSPLLDRVQFPWRALTLLDVAACMLLALLIDSRPPRLRFAAQFTVGAFAVMTALFLVGRGAIGTGPASLSRPASIEDARIAMRADAPEYLPSCRAPRETDVVVDGSTAHIVAAALSDRRAGTLPVFHYPFLHVLADGIPVPSGCDPATGFIVAEIPQGATIDIRKTTLPAERAGYLISIVSLIALLAGLLWRRPAAAIARPA